MSKKIMSLMVFCLFCIDISANPLKSLIINANNNPLLESKNYQTQALKEEKKALYSGYLPKVEVGYAYQNINNPDLFYPKSVNGPFVEASWLLFDGLKREGKFSIQDHKIKASEFSALSTKQQIFLKIIQEYFQALSLKSKRKALLSQQNELEQSIIKYQTFFESGLASQDTLEAIKSQFAQNSYQLENIDLALEARKEQISLLSGVENFLLDDLVNIKEISAQTPQKQRADLQAQFHYVKSLENVSTQYTYLPTIALSNRYTNYQYHNRNIPMLPFPISIEDPKYQNIFGVSVSFVLFDSFATLKAKESAHLQALAANFEYAHQKDSQKRERIIAQSALETAKEKIQWAFSALTSASIAYTYAKEKFNSQLIDYTQYLKALSNLFNAQSFYDEARFDYEIKKAEFLYSNGENLEEFL
ncbi:TolC family protein [Helicobacter sp. 11-8110]|uniref:TolC family protein n=1 Tax=Helicobacter sp. 11-8110 TaxID=2004997 RepID=UPI000DCC27A0|nr:TolC family protein [Helicobacter sp. 11-8110]RAX52820.1 transporter [Helicobacter sp. 11-8110]